MSYLPPMAGTPYRAKPDNVPPLGFRQSLAELSSSGQVSQCDVVRSQVAVNPQTGGAGAAANYVAAYQVKVDAIQGMRRGGETADTAGLIESEALYYCYFPRIADVRASDRLYFPGLLTKWQAAHAYSLGDLVVPASQTGNGHYFVNVAAGNSGNTQPIWDTRAGVILTDGNAVLWREAGRAFALEITTVDDKKSSATNIAVLCKELR